MANVAPPLGGATTHACGGLQHKDKDVEQISSCVITCRLGA